MNTLTVTRKKQLEETEQIEIKLPFFSKIVDGIFTDYFCILPDKSMVSVNTHEQGNSAVILGSSVSRLKTAANGTQITESEFMEQLKHANSLIGNKLSLLKHIKR